MNAGQAGSCERGVCEGGVGCYLASGSRSWAARRAEEREDTDEYNDGYGYGGYSVIDTTVSASRSGGTTAHLIPASAQINTLR